MSGVWLKKRGRQETRPRSLPRPTLLSDCPHWQSPLLTPSRAAFQLSPLTESLEQARIYGINQTIQCSRSAHIFHIGQVT